MTHDVVASSEIEGVTLNTAEVRSSVARKLGVTVPDVKEPTHYIDGMVEMMLDAIMNYETPLTHDRLFGWHSALFPTGKSGFSDILVGSYRTEAMEVVSGTFGRERIHYRAPGPNVYMTKWINFFYGLMPQYSSVIIKVCNCSFLVCMYPSV